jgi:membrane protease YdiL (CAAX protease family)
MQRFIEYLVIFLASLTSIVLIAFQIKPTGWVLLGVCFALLILCRREFAKQVGLVLVALGILGVTPIGTDIHTKPALIMATTLGMAVVLPYLVTKYAYKNSLIRFSWRHGRSWYKTEILYILLAAGVAYLLLPFYLQSTDAYLNWPNPENTEEVIRLFIGTNLLGLWDELFFVGVVLALLSRHMKFWQANIVQGILWTAFLYELGFVSWIFIVIFLFALLQGYIFKKTHSFLYIVTIHLTVDFILFLALLNAHNPTWIPIFIT